VKTCPTCGREHPDDVTTSHHPNNCGCGSTVLHAPDGNNQGPLGCVWMRRFVKHNSTDLRFELFRLMMAYESSSHLAE